MEFTVQERKKLTLVKAQTYLKAGKAKKSAMLDDFCESTGYQRTYAARVLHQAGQRYILGETILVADPGKRIHRYRASRYGPAVQQALISIWAASTFLGPVRLAGGMPLIVENLTMHGHLHIDEETRQLLLRMSPATIGRLLAKERHMYRLHGISHTRSTPLGGRIPIQTSMDPPLDIPGALAVDLVGHEGGGLWTTSGGPLRSLIVRRDGLRQERSGRKQRSTWSLLWNRVSAGTRRRSSLSMPTTGVSL